MGIGEKSSILVTGACGFIGRAVAKLLEQASVRTVLLDCESHRNRREGENSRMVRCDITNGIELEHVFAQQSIRGIIHLAAILPTIAHKEPLHATEVNVQGSLNLLEAARKFGVKRFVFGSSLSIYGTWPANHIVSEADRATPEDLYGAAKLYVERLGRIYADKYGLEFVSLRIGRVIGPGAQSRTSSWRSEIFELLRQKSPSRIALPYVGSERLLLVHVEDVAKMLMILLQVPRPAHVLYNAPCESVVLSDLKEDLQSLNPNIAVALGTTEAVGNPRLLDSSRFQEEFGFAASPIFEQLREAAMG